MVPGSLTMMSLYSRPISGLACFVFPIGHLQDGVIILLQGFSFLFFGYLKPLGLVS